MQKVSFSFPPELVKTIDSVRGEQSRNQFVTRLLKQTLKAERERELARVAEEVYSTTNLAEEDRAISEDFLSIAPEIEP
jgi:metal-responsive CopG/Arc/MetJ family transcriptional regulator